MREVLSALEGGDILRAIKILLNDLYAEQIIDGAVIFCGTDFSAQILTDERRITGTNLQNIEGVAKSFIERALAEKREIFEDHLVVRRGSESSLFYRIQSIYVCPISQQQTVVGLFYIDRIRSEAPFSRAERLWLRFISMLMQLHLKARMVEQQLELLQKDLWIGSSAASEKIRAEIRRLAATSSPILILGETGTGKNLAAEMLHRLSGREGRMVVVSLPAISETLFEAELFGCRKSAFTGAEDRAGLIGEADRGTLFFDEIAEIPLSIQAKLLRFLETGFYKRLGEDKEKRADCKIICASNKDLRQLAQAGKFRHDLYFRISVYTLTIPPLRDRPEDIEEIAKIYLQKNGFSVSERALACLRAYSFPGNVRELQNLLQKSMLDSSDNTIDFKDLSSLLGSADTAARSNLIMQKIEQGENFWQAVKTPFLRKDLNRAEVIEILARGLQKTADGKYSQLLSVFNLHEEEYHRFMAFLHKYRLLIKKGVGKTDAAETTTGAL